MKRTGTDKSEKNRSRSELSRLTTVWTELRYSWYSCYSGILVTSYIFSSLVQPFFSYFNLTPEKNGNLFFRHHSFTHLLVCSQALIDGPETGVPRSALRLNQLHLTKFSIRFPYTAGTRVVRKAWKEGKIDEKWKQSVWFQKVEAKKKVYLWLLCFM